MKLFDNKIFLITFSFLIGGLFSYSIISLESAKNDNQGIGQSIQNVKRQIRKPRVVVSKDIDDISARQQKMMNQMMKVFDQSLSMDLNIDTSIGMVGSNNLKVTEYNDNNYRYVKVMAEDINQDSVKVKVSDGRIDISGEIRKEEKNSGSYGSSSSSYVSSFSKSFDVPELVKEQTAKISVKKGEILIRFEKS